MGKARLQKSYCRYAFYGQFFMKWSWIFLHLFVIFQTSSKEYVFRKYCLLHVIMSISCFIDKVRVYVFSTIDK